MKLLLIIQRVPFPPNDGGALSYWETLRSLHAAGHEVHVFMLNAKPGETDASSIERVTKSYMTATIDTPVTIAGAFKNLVTPMRPDPSGPALSYWVERFISESALDLLLSYYAHHAPFDAVLIESVFSAWYGIQLARSMAPNERASTSIVLRTHNVEYLIQQRLSKDPNVPLRERLYRRFLAYRTARYEKWLMSYLDGVLTVSDTDLRVYSAFSKNVPMRTVMPGTTIISEPRDFSRVIPRSICILGNLTWGPNLTGIQWFLDLVLPIIRQSKPDTTIVIAGKNPSPDVLLYTDKYGVQVIPNVSDPNLFRRMHVVSAVPLLSGSGIRMKILEALATGCPVVTTSVGCEGIGVEHGEHLLIGDTPQDFAQACLSILESEDQGAGMANRALLFAENNLLSWRDTAREITEFLDYVRHSNKSR